MMMQWIAAQLLPKDKECFRWDWEDLLEDTAPNSVSMSETKGQS